MERNQVNTVKKLTSPKSVWMYITILLLTQIFGSTAFQMLVDVIGTEFNPMLGAFLLTLLVGALILLRVQKKLQPIQINDFLKRESRPRKGMIFLLSHRPDACVRAIRHHEILEKCWIICDNNAFDTIEGLRTRFPNVEFVHVVVNEMDMDDPLAFARIINKIYEAQLPMDWTTDDVIADYTGMRKSATAGMVLACFGKNRPLQYCRQPMENAEFPPIEIGTG